MNRLNAQLWIIGNEVFANNPETQIEDVNPAGQWDKWALEYGTEPPADYYIDTPRVAVGHFGSGCGRAHDETANTWPEDYAHHKAIRGELRPAPPLPASNWEVRTHVKVYPIGIFGSTHTGDGGNLWLTVGKAWDGGAIGLYMEVRLVLSVVYYTIQLKRAYGLTFDDLKYTGQGETVATLFEGEYHPYDDPPEQLQMEFDSVFKYSGGWGTVTASGIPVTGAVAYPILGFYAGSWQYNFGKFRAEFTLNNIMRG